VSEEKEQYEATLEAIQMLPEAPASATVRCIVEGFDWMITIREFDQPNPGRQLLTKLKLINAELKKMGAEPTVNNYRSQPSPKKEAAKAPEPKAKAKAKQIPCPTHNVMADLRTRKDTGAQWYSHKLADGTWCNVDEDEGE